VSAALKQHQLEVDDEPRGTRRCGRKEGIYKTPPPPAQKKIGRPNQKKKKKEEKKSPYTRFIGKLAKGLLKAKNKNAGRGDKPPATGQRSGESTRPYMEAKRKKTGEKKKKKKRYRKKT